MGDIDDDDLFVLEYRTCEKPVAKTANQPEGSVVEPGAGEKYPSIRHRHQVSTPRTSEPVRQPRLARPPRLSSATGKPTTCETALST